jgi:hypothetical protein
MHVFTIQLLSELNARRERGLQLPVLPGSTRDQAVQCLQASHPAREAQFESRHLGMAQFEPPAISEKSQLSFYTLSLSNVSKIAKIFLAY